MSLDGGRWGRDGVPAAHLRGGPLATSLRLGFTPYSSFGGEDGGPSGRGGVAGYANAMVTRRHSAIGPRQPYRFTPSFRVRSAAVLPLQQPSKPAPPPVTIASAIASAGGGGSGRGSTGREGSGGSGGKPQRRALSPGAVPVVPLRPMEDFVPGGVGSLRGHWAPGARGGGDVGGRRRSVGDGLGGLSVGAAPCEDGPGTQWGPAWEVDQGWDSGPRSRAASGSGFQSDASSGPGSGVGGSRGMGGPVDGRRRGPAVPSPGAPGPGGSVAGADPPGRGGGLGWDGVGARGRREGDPVPDAPAPGPLGPGPGTVVETSSRPPSQEGAASPGAPSGAGSDSDGGRYGLGYGYGSGGHGDGNGHGAAAGEPWASGPGGPVSLTRPTRSVGATSPLRAAAARLRLVHSPSSAAGGKDVAKEEQEGAEGSGSWDGRAPTGEPSGASNALPPALWTGPRDDGTLGQPSGTRVATGPEGSQGSTSAGVDVGAPPRPYGAAPEPVWAQRQVPSQAWRVGGLDDPVAAADVGAALGAPGIDVGSRGRDRGRDWGAPAGWESHPAGWERAVAGGGLGGGDRGGLPSSEDDWPAHHPPSSGYSSPGGDAGEWADGEPRGHWSRGLGPQGQGPGLSVGHSPSPGAAPLWQPEGSVSWAVSRRVDRSGSGPGGAGPGPGPGQGQGPQVPPSNWPRLTFPASLAVGAGSGAGPAPGTRPSLSPRALATTVATGGGPGAFRGATGSSLRGGGRRPGEVPGSPSPVPDVRPDAAGPQAVALAPASRPPGRGPDVPLPVSGQGAPMVAPAHAAPLPPPSLRVHRGASGAPEAGALAGAAVEPPPPPSQAWLTAGACTVSEFAVSSKFSGQGPGALGGAGSSPAAPMPASAPEPGWGQGVQGSLPGRVPGVLPGPSGRLGAGSVDGGGVSGGGSGGLAYGPGSRGRQCSYRPPACPDIGGGPPVLTAPASNSLRERSPPRPLGAVALVGGVTDVGHGLPGAQLEVGDWPLDQQA